MKTALLTLASLIALLALAGSLTLIAPHTVTGSSELVSEARPVPAFTAVELAGSADVSVVFGQAESVVVEADDNILPLVETSVSEGKLTISTKRFTTIRPSQPVRVILTMKSLEQAAISGAGRITIAGLNTTNVALSLSGSGHIRVTGAVEALQVALNGSGYVHCGDLLARSARVNLAGAGDVTVFTSQDLDAAISGSGDVEYRGAPAQVYRMVTGSGEVLPLQ